MKALTARQRRFLEEYARDRDPAAAYMRAGYSAKGARVNGLRLLDRLAEPAGEADSAAEHPSLTRDTLIRGLLREAEGRGPNTTPAARIAAWDRLGRLLDLHGPAAADPAGGGTHLTVEFVGPDTGQDGLDGSA